MFVWFKSRTRQPPVGDASPLLEHLAGEFAPRIAGLWPAPHGAFVSAPAERRHLICLVLAAAGDKTPPLDADELLSLSAKAVLGRVAPEAPDGLRRALGRLGETAWSREDYERLVYLLATGAKEVRHAEQISRKQVRALSVLPPPLIASRVGGFGLSTDQAKLLAEAFGVIAARDGLEAAAAMSHRWAGASTAEGLFVMVEDDLLPDLPAPPFPGSDLLKPLETKAAIREAAVRFRNCGRSRLGSVAHGDIALYEWTKGRPVMIEIGTDPVYGWRLREAKATGNEAVPKAQRPAMIAELRRMGVHIGRSSWEMRNELGRAHEKDYDYEPPEAEVDWFFE